MTSRYQMARRIEPKMPASPMRIPGSLRLVSSLFLCAGLFTCGFRSALRHLAKHHNTVAVHERDAGQSIAILEAVADQWLLRHELAFGHLVGFQGGWFLGFLTTGFLSNFPDKLGDTASSSATTDETDWRVTLLDLVRDVEDLDLCVEICR